jgi:putative phosphoesterase
MKIGILSDTHGLLRSEVIAGLQGVDHIIHAGDIDHEGVIRELEKIAPVTVVRGNADKEWAKDLPETADLEFAGVRILVIHNKGKITSLPEGVDVVVFGHTHKYTELEKDGVSWFNPGCCGKRRPGQEVSYAIMEIDEQGVFSFEKRTVDTAPAVPVKTPVQQMDKVIRKAMKLTDRGASTAEIAKACKIEEELAESICRMYLTHPGIDVNGILQRIM